MSYGNPVYPDQSFYTSQAPSALFGPSTPPVLNSGAAQLFGPQLASQIDPMLQMGQLFLPRIAPQLQQQGGFMPRFFSTQNYMSQIRAQRFGVESAVAMQGATDTAQANLMELMQGGLVQLQGKPLTEEQRQSVLGLSQQLAPVMNIASALMPSRLADAIYGNGGNPLRLNQGLLTTGQNMYDPITGARGLTGATAGAMGERIYNRLYADPAAAGQMLGTGTAELADLLDNLKQRGLLGAQQSLTDIARNLPQVSLNDASITEIRKRANAQGESVDNAAVSQQYNAMRALAQAGDPQSLSQLKAFATTTTGQEILRAGDADRIARKLKDYNEAIVAIRDIFGESGRPDAPIAELMASLDQLTQGGLATRDPADLARSVRKTFELGRMNNFSMPVIQGLMAQASAQAQAAGLNPELSENITQNAMAFGASTAIDRFMSNRGFGGLNREKLLLTEMQLQTGAAASPTAQRLGAIVAMYKQNQPLTAAMKDIAQIATGEKQGTIDLNKLSEPAVMAELQRGGMSTQTAVGFLKNKQQAQEQIAAHDIGGLVRAELQPQSFRRAMQRTINRTLGDTRISAAVTEGLMGLGIRANVQAEREKALNDALTAQGVTPGSAAEQAMMAKFNVKDRDALIRDVSSQLHNALQSSSKMQAQFGNYQTAIEMMSPERKAAAVAAEREAETSGAFSAILAPLGRGNAISNFVEQLKMAGKTGAPVNIADMLSNAFGVVNEQTLRTQGRDKAADALNAVMQLSADSMKLAAAPDYDKDPKKKEEFKRNLATAAAIMGGGPKLEEQLRLEKAELTRLQATGADEKTRNAQQRKIDALTYVQDTGKARGNENFGLGTIVNESQLLGTQVSTDQAVRQHAFEYAKKHKLLGGRKGEANKEHTLEDIMNMKTNEFDVFMKQLEKGSSDPEKFKALKQQLEQLTTPQAAGGVAAAAAAPATKVDVTIPDKLKLAGSVTVDLVKGLLEFPATEASFQPDMTPPAVNPAQQRTAQSPALA